MIAIGQPTRTAIQFFVRLLPAVASLVLAGIVYYQRNENIRLTTGLSAAVMALESSASACAVPSSTARTAAGSMLSLDFPRQRPLLLLVTDRNCSYCQSALSGWSQTLQRFPLIDGFIFDSHNSYSRADFDKWNLSLGRVLLSLTPIAPYQRIIDTTPTVVLIGRTGFVLGLWTGELSAVHLEELNVRIKTLL